MHTSLVDRDKTMKPISHSQLNRLVDTKAAELGFSLRNDLTWRENAQFLRDIYHTDGAAELADYLEEAEKAWFDLDS